MDIEKVKAKRSTVRELFTKLTTKVENMIQNPVDENYLVENKIEELYYLKKQLEEKLKELKELDNLVEIEIDTKDLKKEITDSDKYRETGINFKTKLDRCLKSLEKERHYERRTETSRHDEGLSVRNESQTLKGSGTFESVQNYFFIL